MAGMGPPPKMGPRRRANTPLRGDWVDLPRTKYTPDTIPPMPERDDGLDWPSRCHRAWCAWWLDPASSQWTEGDITLLELALELYDRSSIVTQAASEFRQLADRLGISGKGKRDLRWRVTDQAAELHVVSAGDAEPEPPAQLDDFRAQMGLTD